MVSYFREKQRVSEQANWSRCADCVHGRFQVSATQAILLSFIEKMPYTKILIYLACSVFTGIPNIARSIQQGLSLIFPVQTSLLVNKYLLCPNFLHLTFLEMYLINLFWYVFSRQLYVKYKT